MRIYKILLIVFTLLLVDSFLFCQVKEEQLESDKKEKQYSVGETRLLVLKSVILPGWGEHSMGKHKRGYIFNTTELLGWLSYAAFTLYKDKTRDDMKAFAANHAGIDPDGRSNQYFVDIGNYMNMHDYNEQKRRYRQVNLIYGDDKAWAWDSKTNQKKFDDMRLKSRLAKRNRNLVTSALILNRLFSVIDIATLTKGKIKNPYSDKIDTVFIPGNNSLTMLINFHF